MIEYREVGKSSYEGGQVRLTYCMLGDKVKYNELVRWLMTCNGVRSVFQDEGRLIIVYFSEDMYKLSHCDLNDWMTRDSGGKLFICPEQDFKDNSYALH